MLCFAYSAVSPRSRSRRGSAPLAAALCAHAMQNRATSAFSTPHGGHLLPGSVLAYSGEVVVMLRISRQRRWRRIPALNLDGQSVSPSQRCRRHEKDATDRSDCSPFALPYASSSTRQNSSPACSSRTIRRWTGTPRNRAGCDQSRSARRRFDSPSTRTTRRSHRDTPQQVDDVGPALAVLIAAASPAGIAGGRDVFGELGVATSVASWARTRRYAAYP